MIKSNVITKYVYNVMPKEIDTGNGQILLALYSDKCKEEFGEDNQAHQAGDILIAVKQVLDDEGYGLHTTVLNSQYYRPSKKT